HLLLAGRSTVDTACLPVVTITQNKKNICLDSAIIFSAAITNNGTNGTYRWIKNGANAGVNKASYTAADFREGDVVTCEYSCTSVCNNVVTVLSNSITVHVINDITPVVTVANNDPLICEGELTL